MSASTLTVSGQGRTWQIEPNPACTIIGRSSLCDVVLDCKDVSREHARIFQDPFGRWIVDDLGSSNGVLIDAKRVESAAVLPGEPMVIGSFRLSITEPLDPRIEPDESIETTATITAGGFETEVVAGRAEHHEILAAHYVKKLDEVVQSLSQLTSCSALYPQVCRLLAETPEEVAMVLRLPEKTQPLPRTPEVLACHFGGKQDDAAGVEAAALRPPRFACRLSRHLLESLRSTGNAAMIKTIFSSDEDVTWSAVDEHSPRAVVCAPLGDVAKPVDLLYLDIPVDSAAPGIVEFVQAVARQVIFARKALVLVQTKAQRCVLDYQLSLARQIQSRLTPELPQDLSGVDFALYHKPVIWVGGDYCDVWSLDDGRLTLAVGDVSGRGLPAAMALPGLKLVLRTAMALGAVPAKAMRLANLHVLRNLPEDVHVSLFLGLFDPRKSTLEYINAGHMKPIIIAPESTVVGLGQQGNPALGVADASFQAKVETVGRAACVLVFTDGITQATARNGDKFGFERLVHLLKTGQYHCPADIIDSVINAVENFRKPSPQTDDITVFALANRQVDAATTT
jgi:serine phosphatase RsbU (regulator of sigma subunit)/pSer/pThr/pTyr-binding forkhead associated (FHA) protein